MQNFLPLAGTAGLTAGGLERPRKYRFEDNRGIGRYVERRWSEIVLWRQTYPIHLQWNDLPWARYKKWGVTIEEDFARMVAENAWEWRMQRLSRCNQFFEYLKKFLNLKHGKDIVIACYPFGSGGYHIDSPWSDADYFIHHRSSQSNVEFLTDTLIFLCSPGAESMRSHFHLTIDRSQWEGDTIRATWGGVPLDVKATKKVEMAESGHLCGLATRWARLRMEKMIEQLEYALPALLV